MSSSSRLALVVVIIFALCAGIYLVISPKVAPPAEPANNPVLTTDEEDSGAPMGKVAASAEADGEYFVQVKSVNANPEDTTLTLSHVTYYEGDEALLSAEAEAECPSGVLEDCVPTLKNGFYVRPSGAPEWTAPVSTEVVIVLSSKVDATTDDLAARIAANAEAVMVVTVESGVVTKIEEKTR